MRIHILKPCPLFHLAGGSFAVYKKNNISDEFELLLSGRDPNPIPIKYIGFASKNNQRLRYYYDCPFFPSNDEIKFKGLELPSNLLQTIYTESEFLAKCKRVVTGDNDYKNFIPVPDTSRPPGYVFRFPFYIRGAFDSHILLTEKPVADPSVHNYEFSKNISFLFSFSFLFIFNLFCYNFCSYRFFP